MSWLQEFRNNYYQNLNARSSGAKRGLVEGHCCRGDGFEMIFQLLLEQNLPEYHIVETGTLRNPGNWKDGQSARLFVEFVTVQHGTVRSVDIDPHAVATAREAIQSDRFSVFCSDSVSWLQQQSDLDRVNLFYLDSWDVKWNNDSDSAEHHLREFQAIENHMRPGAVVAIDDNSRFADTLQRTGKGRRIVEYLESQGHRPLYDAYQIIYQF